MPSNKKRTSSKVASLAARTLQNSASSKIARELAGSALSQTGNRSQTGSIMEDKAARVLKSKKYNSDTKKLAGSVLAQANKKR